MLNKYNVTCEAGHSFEIDDIATADNLPLDPKVIAAISWCPLDVPKPELGGIIVACGSRIVLVRDPPKPKQRKFLWKRGVDKGTETS